MNRKIISTLLMVISVFCSINTCLAGGIGSEVKKPSLTGMRVGAYNTKANISVIEYNTYGAETGYYINDGFGTTTKYDTNGNVV